MLPIKSMGNRIMILGPSNAGKSTLALAISMKLNIPVVHIDRLQHLPNTDWKIRDEEDFKALHHTAIMEDRWVMDGNYSRHMPQRFERATGVILLTSNRWLRLARYLKRSLRPSASRIGGLEGGAEYIKWEMIHWIIFQTPKNIKRYSKAVKKSSLPSVECHSILELNALYKDWGMELNAK